MHPLRLAFCALSLLVLQSCDDVTRDLILRSNSQAILPLGPVHTPPADSLSRVQTSLSLSGMSGGEVPMALQKNSSGSGTASSDLVGPARLSISPLQASGALSFWVADHFRFGAGVEVGGTGAAGSLETGLRFGRALSVEGFCGVGMASVHSAVDWDLFTRHSEDDGGGPNDTSHTYQSQEGEESHLFTRAGLHMARRAGGPWLELEVASQNLFIAPRSGTVWEANAFTAAAGWAFRTPSGTIVLFGRGTNLGAGWIPSIGLQWSPEFPMR